MSLRREAARLREGQEFWRLIRELGVRVLPNTAGCHTVKEAVTTAQMAREIFDTAWIKLEVIGEADTLAARRVRAGRGGAHPRRRRLRGVPLHDRGSRRRRAPARGRLPGADAVGRADRLRAGAQQPVRAAGAARAFSRRAAGRRRRHRPAVACRGGDGARLRRDPAQHRGRQGRRSRRDGARHGAGAIEAGRAAYLAGRCSRATWRRPRRRCSARRASR